VPNSKVYALHCLVINNIHLNDRSIVLIAFYKIAMVPIEREWSKRSGVDRLTLE
jgi:hypothetical protein